jgi:hypothetical protein
MTFLHRQTRTVTVDEDDMEVVCVYSVARAEPDVGIMSDYVDDLYLEYENGDRAHYVENGLSQDEWDDLCVRIMEDHE